MYKPIQTWLFTIAVFILLSLLSLMFPKNGIYFGKNKLSFPSLTQLFGNETNKKDISKILAAADSLDVETSINNTTQDTTLSIKDSVVKLNTGLQFRNRTVLSNFFDALINLKVNPKSIRVLHYGDSQIEGDRITDYLRQKWQGQFGGNGPGLLSVMPISQSAGCKVTFSTSWDKYGAYLAKDKRIKHNNYGVLINFNRYTPVKNITDSSQLISATINIATNKSAGNSYTNYNKLKLFYGGALKKTWCEFYDGPALISADSLVDGGNFNIKQYNVSNGTLNHHFKLYGKDSPDFYGISLEGDNGVIVDNIALRGSSGTFFHLVNNSQLKQFYDYLNVKLVILQFGGNVLPSLKTVENANNYADWMRGQISTLKKLVPNASIIFIGPSDMSVKEGTEYITHPMLEPLRDALKKVTLESDCAYFDMYDCMGGKNSMPSWVDQNYAAKDYIHFSPQGARKIATLLYSAINNEYVQYNKSKK
ncbi:MAG: GDSL-type esterase/lipase family protein [Bacteroidia bacterium]